MRAAQRPANVSGILVVGAGAVGGTVAARLVRSGAELRVFDANEDHVRLLCDPGLEVGGLDGGRITVLDASTDPPTGVCDVVLLAVRSQATEAALDAVRGSIGESTDIVSLQNGLNEDRIAAVVGSERTVGCVVGFGATWVAPGHVTLDASGDLVIGRLDGTSDARLERVRDLLALAFPTSVTDNVRGALWAKMLVNSMTVMGALGGMLTGDVLATPARRATVTAVIAEGIRVAHACGVALPPVFGAVDPALVEEPGFDEAMERVLVRLRDRFGPIKSVTWRDFELGRSTEIDAVTGEIVRRGAAAGVATPVGSAIYAMLKEIEGGNRSPVASNLDDLVVRT